MKRLLATYLFLLAMLTLPLLGIWISGDEMATYLEFPPRTHHVEHAPFSWPVFIGLACVILATVIPFLLRIVRTKEPRNTPPVRHFPWWGWLSAALGILFWVVAWTRLPLFKSIQPYTFTPQWFAYIGVVNALTWRKTGNCLLTRDPRSFLALFPLSAAFWWFFEYLNRFVQNWYYTGFPFNSPLHYFLAATLPFATVLPAVLSTEEWLASNPRTSAGLERFVSVRIKNTKGFSVGILLLSAFGLLFIGRFPDQLYPLLWIAPLLLIIAFQTLTNQPAFFPEVGTGDWRRVYRLSLAALICGFFWELWNWNSLAQWIYSVPYVDRFLLFEMPLLGFAGYLPFGLECAVIAALFQNSEK